MPPYAARKELAGVDFQYVSKSGPLLLAEFLSGKYESRSYFANPTATSLTTKNPAKGNKVEGYYTQAGWTFGQRGIHPLSLVVSWDVFKRSKSGIRASAPGGASGDSFTDENFGYDVLYNLDMQTRFRLWYEKPDEVAHAAGTDSPPEIGLMTGEMQVRF